MQEQVAVVALMVGLEAQESGSRLDCCGGALALPEKCAEVVRSLERRALSQVKACRGGKGLNDTTSKLKVGIGEPALGIVPCGEVVGDVTWERHAPDNGPRLSEGTPAGAGLGSQWLPACNGSGSWEDDATGTMSSCIMGTMDSGHHRNKFLDANGSVFDCAMQIPKIVKDSVDVFSEAKP